MSRLVPLILAPILVTFSPSNAQNAGSLLRYSVDLANQADDLFHVTLNPPPLSDSDSIYSFTAFAPGVHQVLDFGRFVKSFEAFDKSGASVSTTRRSTNDWAISAPRRVTEIRYQMEDSFDAQVEKHVIYPMSGTGIEPEYIAINTHGLFGYFVNLRSNPVTIDLKHDPDWVVGTALDPNSDGLYAADSYYHLADSPILLGNLTTASRKVGEIDVDVFVYSPNPVITADSILAIAGDVLEATYEFIGYAPVDRYAFLMYFNDSDARERNPALQAGGALEHSYSSTYALPAVPEALPIIRSVIAHEFLHILTPLHLRSEIIAEWDYSRPTAEDKHLWLYEGVTEWAAGVMQLRGGLIDIDEYLRVMSQKITSSEQYESDWSLARLSAEWFTDEGSGKYGDIYQLGPLTAMCLDLRILELSNGERGLRETFFELMERYGRDRPFNNDTFFDELVEVTYPEIRSFIDNHIARRQPLDYQRYLDLVGVRYTEVRPSEDPTPQFGLRLAGSADHRLAIAGFSKEHEPFGLKKGDVILRIFDQELTAHNTDSVFAKKEDLKSGDSYTIRVERDGEELEFEGRLVPQFDYHVLEVDKNASDAQKRMRRIWSSNR